jgi:DNA-binding transcriptional regulator GbsR (MarR family)
MNDRVINICPQQDNVLPFIGKPTNSFKTIYKAMIKRDCKSLRFEQIDVQNVERIFISQPTGKFRDKHSSTHEAYCVGFGIEANHNYDFTGYQTVDPDTQQVTVVFEHAKKLKTDIESFKLTDKIHKQLQQFEVKENTAEAIYDRLQKLYTVYAHNITQIYHRFELHLAIDLAFHTAISFKFANEDVKKGWADIVVIGDGRTGKGFVAERMANYYNLGEVASGDNCTLPGLIGGCTQIKQQWTVSWGRIPLNDLGLLVLDEASGLGDGWQSLSRIRSEGVAEIDKIIKSETNARTRLIALTNPVNRKISQFSYGIQALKEVIKAPEDIARFDYALVVGDNEVSDEEVNKIRLALPEMNTREADQNLILWVWSRQTDEIEFSKEAVDAIYDLAIRIAKVYVSDIPLIQGANVRIKLAKIGLAFAARCYSNKQDGKVLLVDRQHIDCAYVFLNTIYKRPVSGYYTMSQLTKSLSSNYNESDIGAIDAYLSSFNNNRAELCKCLINNNVITVKDIAEHLNFSQEIAQEVVSKMLKYNMIAKKFQNCYIKNKHFTDWLKIQVLRDNKIEES